MLAPYGQEFACHFVALIVGEKNAVGGRLVRIAAGDYVDQHPALGEPIEGRGHARCQRGRHDARPHRNQKLEPLGARHQRGCDHPCIFAGVSRGQQHRAVAELIDGLRYLPQVSVVSKTRAMAGAEIAAVSRGGNEPEHFHSDFSCLRQLRLGNRFVRPVGTQRHLDGQRGFEAGL